MLYVVLVVYYWVWTSKCRLGRSFKDRESKLNPFKPSVVFHIETSHLICTANQLTGFYMKSSTGLKWFNILESRNINPFQKSFELWISCRKSEKYRIWLWSIDLNLFEFCNFELWIFLSSVYNHVSHIAVWKIKASSNSHKPVRKI